jgi:hypothetical protein
LCLAGGGTLASLGQSDENLVSEVFAAVSFNRWRESEWLVMRVDGFMDSVLGWTGFLAGFWKRGTIPFFVRRLALGTIAVLRGGDVGWFSLVPRVSVCCRLFTLYPRSSP